jgi:BirA family biotin operon repressor/biotin-[acetyl-CoA-carboxylase] ligase
MDVARAAGERGIGGRLAIFADRQSRGRGRDGRQWLAPAGRGVLCSTLWRDVGVATQLPRLCAVAAIGALARFGFEARLKWPNDILIDGAKVGGILVEGFFVGERFDFAVAGIGLNVLQRQEELPAAPYPTSSLWLASGRAVDRAHLASALLDGLAEPPIDVQDRWQAALIDPWRVSPTADDVGVFQRSDRSVAPES